MMSIKKYVPWFLFGWGFCLAHSAWAQTGELAEDTTQVTDNKYAVYGNVGVAPNEVYFTGTFYMEGVHLEGKKASTYLKGGLGGYAAWGEGGPYVLLQYGVLLGAQKHHLEISAGPMAFLPTRNSSMSGFLSGAVGYRYQKPIGTPRKFIFRMGAGWPEAIYIGIGTTF